MKRAEPMKRSGFKPSVAKPAPGRKPRKCAVKTCRKPFIPFRALESWCSPECGLHVATARTVAQKAKAARAERAADKVKREGMKSYPQLIADVQRVFNAVVRMRDMLAGYPCISSGRELDWSGNATDAGHFRSRGSAPHLRFNFDNCHAQTKQENRFNSGNAVDYRLGLIKRIGLERVEALEADNTPRKWSREELAAMKADFQRMLNEMKKAAA